MLQYALDGITVQHRLERADAHVRVFPVQRQLFCLVQPTNFSFGALGLLPTSPAFLSYSLVLSSIQVILQNIAILERKFVQKNIFLKILLSFYYFLLLLLRGRRVMTASLLS